MENELPATSTGNVVTSDTTSTTKSVSKKKTKKKAAKKKTTKKKTASTGDTSPAETPTQEVVETSVPQPKQTENKARGTSQSKRRPGRNPAQRPPKSKHSLPVVKDTISLRTSEAQAFLQKNFEFVSRRCFAATLTMLDFNQEKAAMLADDIISEALNTCQNGLEEADRLLDEVLNNNGIKIALDYSNRQEITVPTLTPIDNHYMQLVALYDEILPKMYMAFRGGAMKMMYYNNEKKRVRGLLIKLTSKIRVVTEPAVRLMKSPRSADTEKAQIFEPLLALKDLPEEVTE